MQNFPLRWIRSFDIKRNLVWDVKPSKPQFENFLRAVISWKIQNSRCLSNAKSDGKVGPGRTDEERSYGQEMEKKTDGYGGGVVTRSTSRERAESSPSGDWYPICHAPHHRQTTGLDGVMTPTPSRGIFIVMALTAEAAMILSSLKLKLAPDNLAARELSCD